ncbi:PPE domain-containing protein [Amycolatopsis deserti]|nr:PPE domain-containing protein [Amycolatopsis deserti]
MSGQQIYENFHNAPGPGELQQAQHHLRMVMKKYEVRAEQVTSLAGAMEEGWTGDAANAAVRSVGPLAVAHSGAAAAMKTANDLIESQSQAFFDTKNKVVPVPEAPQTPPTLAQQIFQDNSLTQMAQIAAANAAAKQNVEAMQAWSTTSGDNGARMPTTYGTLDAGVLGVSQGAQPGGSVDIQNKPTSDGPSFGGAGGASRGGGGVTGGTSSLSGPYQAPTGQIPPDGRTVASDAAYAPPAAASYNPPQPSGGSSYGTPGGSAYGVPGYGNTAGYRGANPAGGRFGVGTGGGAGRGGGVGSGRGFGAGGAGRGAGAGFGPGSNPLSEAKRFGAGNPAAAGESFARGGGASGRAGAAGSPGAMGAGAGNRGKGEDDGEHQRKYIVDEDEHFQLTAEGEKAVDPITGLTVSPPVLGQ